MAMARQHLFTIHGAKWLLKFVRLRGQANGYAYLPEADGRQKTTHKILIDTRMPHGSRAQLETIIHELLHVSFPIASEHHVTEAGRDITRILWHLGWRLDETKSPD